ncbi:MAG: crossover junction endodeoxyribonuclease RuvC [Clostridia bacterium]|nr:crossover junction endodeoxyribonuclease RuvC [Clostridia bacterium]
MIVLGIDPGYAIVGFGVIRYEKGAFIPLEYGSIITAAGDPFERRLEIIYDRLYEILDRHKPSAVSIEKLYYKNNAKTVIGVAEARGVITLACQKHKVPIFEYTPLQVKTAVTGYGRAEKYQVQEMTRRFLRLQAVPKPDDTADALAIAICHCQASGSALRSNFLNRR